MGSNKTPARRGAEQPFSHTLQRSAPTFEAHDSETQLMDIRRAITSGASFIQYLISTQQVRTEYDQLADFGTYHTYSWKKVDVRDPLMLSLIVNALDFALPAKGLRRKAWDGSISLFATIDTRNNERVNTSPKKDSRTEANIGERCSYSRRFDTLIIEMLDAQTRKLIWRSSATGAISDRKSKTLATLEKTVAMMLKHFPPESRDSDPGILYIP